MMKESVPLTPQNAHLKHFLSILIERHIYLALEPKQNENHCRFVQKVFQYKPSTRFFIFQIKK